MMSSFSTNSSIFTQISDDIDSLSENYKILTGNWPKEYNELVLVLSDENSISDLLLYLLGLRDIDELYDIMGKVMSGEEVDIDNKPMEFTYEDFLNLDLKLINSPDLYKYNKKYEIYEDMREDEKYMKNIYEKAEKLKIVGIVCPKDGTSSFSLSTGIGYKASLIEHVISESSKSDIVKKQLKKENIDVFSNKKFDEVSSSSELNFNDLISVDTKMLQSAFKMDISEEDITKLTSGYMDEISKSITTDITPAKESLKKTMEDIATNSFKYYIKNPYQNSNGIPTISLNDSAKYVTEYLNTSEVNSILKKLEDEYLIPTNVYKEALSSLLTGLYQSYIASYAALDPSYTTDQANPIAPINNAMISSTVSTFMNQTVIVTSIETLAGKMTEAKMQSTILTKVGELTGKLMNSIASSFNVDSKKIAAAFNFDLSESELSRLMNAMANPTEKTAQSNLQTLGYQDLNDPTYISIYFSSFDNKELFLKFLDDYNENVEEEQKINYTDPTGILMSSVKKIVDSVSYVLIAFVSIALIVSSIMIGIITYISVLERTKEIGILRAIGASKKNISSIFNAETFIIGLLSGLIGIGFTLAVIPIINNVIHTLTNNYSINAAIPFIAALVLITLSVILTLIGGLIPSRMASKKIQ